jgi:hypothetical protein
LQVRNLTVKWRAVLEWRPSPCKSRRMETVEPREIRTHVERISSSSVFADSERLRRFLRFTVESTLADRHTHIKEYVLGREVFDRDDAYDPRLDPIVRVEARRLRSKLKQYYEGPGRSDAIRLDYPKGSYVPVFARASLARRVQLPYRGIGVLLGLTLLAGVIAFWQWQEHTPRLIAIVPEQWVWNESTPSDGRAVPLAEELTGALANRGKQAVVAWPLIAHGATPGRPLAEIAARLHASRIYSLGVHGADGGDVVRLFIIDPRSGRKYRALEYVTPVESLAERRALALRIAGDLTSATTR